MIQRMRASSFNLTIFGTPARLCNTTVHINSKTLRSFPYGLSCPSRATRAVPPREGFLGGTRSHHDASKPHLLLSEFFVRFCGEYYIHPNDMSVSLVQFAGRYQGSTVV